VKQDDDASLRYRVFSYSGLQDYDQAIADYNQALQLNPDDAMASVVYINRGVAYYNQTNFPHAHVRARADWEKALQLDPSYAKAWDNLQMLPSERQ
jgi:tetratricopeptide (TPR) repeat protein